MTSAPSRRHYAFAGYRLDLQTRVLLGPDGAPVVLTRKAFDVLVRDKPRFQAMASKVGFSGGQAHGRF